MALDYYSRERLEKIGSAALSFLFHSALVVVLLFFALGPTMKPPEPEIVFDYLQPPPDIPKNPRPTPPDDPTPGNPNDPPVDVPPIDDPLPPSPPPDPTITVIDLPRHDGPVVYRMPIPRSPYRPRDPRKAADEFGVPKDVQEAVNRALEWLRIHQLADGAWEGEDRVAMTGLGLLTFLAHNETTVSPRYGQTVERAVRHLIAAARDNGRFSENVYAHAIATYALAEAYGMLRIPDIRPCLERGVQAILDGQQTAGSWDYSYRKDARRDTSVAGWQIQALKAARIAGVESAGIDAALTRAAADLRGVQDAATGRFAYSEPGKGGSDAMTGAGTLCLQLVGGIKDEATRRGMAAMRDFECDWKDDGKWSLYTWYYVTQANFHYSKATWERWKDRIARTLVGNQAADGSWTPTGNEAKQGPAYGTTLAALTLQVYSRYLPTYRQTAVAAAEPDLSDTPDVQIEVREM